MGSGDSALTVSLVIPALNEGATVPELMAWVEAMRPPPLEVILVDGGSTDRYAEC